MDDVGGGAGELGERHQVMHAPASTAGGRLSWCWPGSVLPAASSPCSALGNQRLVFTVGGDDDAEFLGELERPVELGVVDAEGAFVGEEDFEGLMPRRTISQGAGPRCRRRISSRPCGTRNRRRSCPRPAAIQSSNRGARVVPARGTAHLDERHWVPPTSAACEPVT